MLERKGEEDVNYYYYYCVSYSKRFEYPTTTLMTKDDESMRNSTACLTKYDGDEYNTCARLVLRKKTNSTSTCYYLLVVVLDYC